MVALFRRLFGSSFTNCVGHRVFEMMSAIGQLGNWTMKKRFTEEQIIDFLREANAGLSARELCRTVYLFSLSIETGLRRVRTA